MLVKFRQTGGFAGLSRGCDLDSAALSPSDAAELERLVRAAGLDKLKSARGPGADRQQYEIEVHDGARRVAATFDDSALTDPVAALVAFLKARAKPMPLP
jgi:hypothetical protein